MRRHKGQRADERIKKLWGKNAWLVRKNARLEADNKRLRAESALLAWALSMDNFRSAG